MNESPDRAGRPRRPPRKAPPNRYRRGIAGGYGEEEQRRAAGCIGRPATGGDSFTDSELVDVLDAAGRPVATVTRREMRVRRLPHRATYVLVFNRRGELFVHLRSPHKDVFPGHWDVAVGGVLAAGESFDEGARREAREELGVDLEPEPLFPLHYADERTVVHGMVYRARHDGPFRLQPEEIVRGEFLALAAVAARAGREPFCPDGLAALAEYRRRWPDRRD